MVKRIGLLYGTERSFPLALAQEIELHGDGEVHAEPVEFSQAGLEEPQPYDLILDRVSHEVPFYRSLLKQCCQLGIQVVNNPFWAGADDRYFGCTVARTLGVAVPRTALLPHKHRPPNTDADSFRNLRFPWPWDEVFAHVGFPLVLKAASDRGGTRTRRCADEDSFFDAYARSGARCMMAQEEIEHEACYRCFVIGRERVRVMRYEPAAPQGERYPEDADPPPFELRDRMERDALELCRALGYDFNTVEFAVRDGVPHAVDFTNPCPDADPARVGREHFEWILEESAAFLLHRVREPRPLELTGTWPERLR
jgi:glutathione synthase/RimK-type ligase-like ATP-grasp enzyme